MASSSPNGALLLLHVRSFLCQDAGSVIPVTLGAEVGGTRMWSVTLGTSGVTLRLGVGCVAGAQW